MFCPFTWHICQQPFTDFVMTAFFFPACSGEVRLSKKMDNRVIIGKTQRVCMVCFMSFTLLGVYDGSSRIGFVLSGCAFIVQKYTKMEYMEKIR